MTHKQEVAMKVNPQKWVESLKYSFTNKTTVLSELMQNARRAGASAVRFDYTTDSATESNTLVVSDDGCGIESMQTLLSVAESGWKTDLVNQEHPFGIGFLSALFACRHLLVTSNGKEISANTQDILAFKTIPVTPCEWKGTTDIVLTGMELDEQTILNTLRILARGFPIPVYFNGECLERPAAEDSDYLVFIDTEIGKVYLHGLVKPSLRNSSYEVYLQGLPIYRTPSFYSDRHHVIHLNSSCFDARLPDRDKLIDEEGAIERITAVLRQAIEKRLRSMKMTLAAEEFAMFYQMMRDWQLLHLLNDVPVVPWEVLKEIVSYPVCSCQYGDFLEYPRKPVTRDEIEARGIATIDDVIEQDGAGRYLFAWKKGYLVYDKRYLDSGHWLHDLIDNLQTQELRIEPVNGTDRYIFEGELTSINVRFCDYYRIYLGDDMIEIHDGAVYLGSDNDCEAIMPKQDASGFVLKQVGRYENEYDDFQKALHEADVEALSRFCIANTTTDPTDAVASLLPDFSGCPLLYGKSFRIRLDPTGKVAKVEAA